VELVGIEQTTSGLWQKDNWPEITVIEVAGSAVKRFVEPPLIAEAVIKKARFALQTAHAEKVCGVIGLGNIGTAVARALAIDGWTVVGYDISNVPVPLGVEVVASLDQVITRADYVFGCTGRDIFGGVTELPPMSKGEKVLFSCSSEDVEFQSLVRGKRQTLQQPLLDVVIPAGHGSWRIVRGGYPINFDGSPTSVPSALIQLTRGLLLSGVLQATLCSRSRPNRTQGEKLWPQLQQFVLRAWTETAQHHERFEDRAPMAVAA
jgi:hypothetical protein